MGLQYIKIIRRDQFIVLQTAYVLMVDDEIMIEPPFLQIDYDIDQFIMACCGFHGFLLEL
jgi:hypothetical protein